MSLYASWYCVHTSGCEPSVQVSVKKGACSITNLGSRTHDTLYISLPSTWGHIVAQTHRFWPWFACIQTPPISGVTYWLTLQSFHATAASAAQELLYQRNEIFLMKGLEDGLKTGSTIGCEPQLGTARAAPS